MNPVHLDHLYSSSVDPFGFDSKPAEAAKFAKTLELCGGDRLGRVLEIGCSVGTLTEIIAPHAESVLAIDVSHRAVALAAERLVAFPNVRCEVCAIPDDYPEGTFDVVIASDVLYYLSPGAVSETIRRIEASVAPGGVVVALHYAPRMGSLLTGDEVHDLLTRRSQLMHVTAERVDFRPGRTYRVDVFRQQSNHIVDGPSNCDSPLPRGDECGRHWTAWLTRGNWGRPPYLPNRCLSQAVAVAIQFTRPRQGA
jgi:SAM-dependent methyltransferase